SLDRPFRTGKWPLGEAYRLDSEHLPSLHQLENKTGATLPDEDAGSTKAWLVNAREDPAWSDYFERAYGKRPREEHYDFQADPHQMRNIAGETNHAAARAKWRNQLFEELKRTEDPRAREIEIFAKLRPCLLRS